MKRCILALVVFILFTPLFPASGEPLRIMASIHPVADLVRQVGGENVDVTVVVPPGASPHTFELKPGVIQKFSQSRLFFMVGSGMEFWADPILKSTGTSFETVVLSEGLPLLTNAGHAHHSTEKKSHDHSHPSNSANPHVWLDPTLAAQMVDRIARTLGRADSANGPIFLQRSEDYQKQLEDLDRRIQAAVATFRIRQYVAFHPAWDYFSRRYGLVCEGVIEATPGRNPTPRTVADIVKKIKKFDIRAVFAEPQFNAQTAEVIAQEAGVRVLFLDPIGGPQVPKGGTYLELMEKNLEVMREAMR